MLFTLTASEADTLQWVLRCYLADRATRGGPAAVDDDVRAMLHAAARDRRDVLSLLTRLAALDASESLPAPAARTPPVPARPPVMLPVAAAASSALRAV
ncbi:MAG TPA: hypothetical protein VFY79_11165 [Dehalococcoidia bacterium]|nr:hypothetical protein [Dehalococcoidia bacterium]